MPCTLVCPKSFSWVFLQFDFWLASISTICFGPAANGSRRSCRTAWVKSRCVKTDLSCSWLADLPIYSGLKCRMKLSIQGWGRNDCRSFLRVNRATTSQCQRAIWIYMGVRAKKGGRSSFKWRCPKMEVPPSGFIRPNPMNKWMMTWGTPILANPQIHSIGQKTT